MRKSLRLLNQSTTFIVMLSLVISGCSKSGNGGDNPTPPGGTGGATVITNVRGIIVDENNAVVVGATVKAGTASTTTDALGVFSFKDVVLDKDNGYVKVEKTGFFINGRSFLPSAGRTHEVRFVLTSTTASRNYVVNSATSISTPIGEKITWTGSVLQTTAGTTYAGIVTPVFVPLGQVDVTRAKFIMAGDFRGLDAAGNEKVIVPFNYLSALLFSNSGQTLKLATGSVAAVEMPIESSLQPIAPATIPVWVFNDTTGRWMQQGTATKTANKYIFNIDRLGHWVCAVPYDGVRVNGSVKNEVNNDPIACAILKIYNNTSALNYKAINTVADSSGYFDFMIPANTSFKLGISDNCTYDMATWNLSPYSTTTSLGSLSSFALSSNIYTYKGAVKNCSGGLVNNGAVVFFSGAHRFSTLPIVNGQFSFTMLACTPVAIRYYAIDYATGLKSPIKTFSPPGTVGGTFNLGDINTCATYTGEFLNLSIDGNNYSFVSPTDSIGVATFNSPSYPGYSKSTLFTIKSYAAGNPYGNYQINQFSFYHNGVAGTLPVNTLGSGPVTIFVTPPVYFSQNFVANSFPEVNITNFGPVGTGFIEGNFTWQIVVGTNKTVTGSFKIRNN